MTIEELFPKDEYPLRATARLQFGEYIMENDIYYQSPFQERQKRGSVLRYYLHSTNALLFTEVITFTGNFEKGEHFQLKENVLVRLTTQEINKLPELFPVIKKLMKWVRGSRDPENSLSMVTWRPL